MARGRKRKIPASRANNDDDENLNKVLRQSQMDFDQAEELRRQEEEDLQKAINESLKPSTSTESETVGEDHPLPAPAAPVNATESEKSSTSTTKSPNAGGSSLLPKEPQKSDSELPVKEIKKEKTMTNLPANSSSQMGQTDSLPSPIVRPKLPAKPSTADNHGEDGNEENDYKPRKEINQLLDKDQALLDKESSDDEDLDDGSDYEPEVPCSTPQPKTNAQKRNRGRINGGANRFDAEDETLDTTGIEEFATSFLSNEAELHTVNRSDVEGSNFRQQFEEIDSNFILYTNSSRKADIRNMHISSIVLGRGQNFHEPYMKRKESFVVLNIPFTEEIVYYNSYNGNSRNVLWNIVKKHFKPFRTHGGKQALIHGDGVYLHKKPDTAKAMKTGIVVCKVLTGKKYEVKKVEKTAIPDGFHTKYVNMNHDPLYVVPSPDLILPLGVIQCVKGAPNAPLARINGASASGSLPDLAGPAAQRLEEENDKVREQMAKLFEKSLKLHLTGKYMQACDAITTPLYPHQMYALAWMAQKENTRVGQMRGGILADDMGLGKTLTVLSLILSNSYDNAPHAKPIHGYVRPISKSAAKYMPQSILNNKDNAGHASGGVRKKAKTKEVKDANGKVKSSSKFLQNFPDTDDDDDNECLDETGDADEFDFMVDDNDSFGKRLGIDSSSSDLFKPKKKNFFDDLSSDEEYQNMTEKERNEKLAPKISQLDGNCDSSDDDEITSSKNRKKKAVIISDSEDDDPDIFVPNSSSTNEIKDKEVPKNGGHSNDQSDSDDTYIEDDWDVDLDEVDSADKALGIDNDKERPKNRLPKVEKLADAIQLTETQKKNLIIPPKQPAKLNGRRRATLIVTPQSLISHWLEQIVRHVDKSVHLDIRVHHGSNKMWYAKDLEDTDIVFTTYGTLQHELDKDDINHGPLLRAKWLRVVMDEGHMIKNNRSQTFKAASRLDTKRKWIISGTPIQNNLKELWALMNWLDEPQYGEKFRDFNDDVIRPVNRGDMHGVIRLQVIVDAMMLRRTKKDEIDGKPLVKLPKKTITLKELDFTSEERTIYEAYAGNAKKIIQKYMKKGTLLRNYAHVFAIMMRLRQLCCHRELLPLEWNNLDINEIVEMVKREAEQEMDEEDKESAKRLAEQLRDMIKDGMSDECSICLSDMAHPVITPCAHVYCRICIVQVIDSGNPPGQAPCPLCRGPLEKKALLEAAIDEENENATENNPEDVAINTDSTKVDAAMKKLLEIRKNTPEDKTIIVSQFTSLLSILQPLLKDHGFKFTRLDGTMNMKQKSNAITKFQEEGADSPMVMLLSLRAGGVGLNLNCANHMILMDPAWNPSTEDQCFDRIHRLGQTKDVEIVRFTMKDSIEKQMLDIQEKKKDLIAGAFRQTEQQRREQRIRDIRDMFGL